MAKAKTAEKHDLLPNQKTGPMTTIHTGPAKPFDQCGTKRAGDTKYASYPDASTSNPAYCGGTK
jgi:hypothetical protein